MNRTGCALLLALAACGGAPPTSSPGQDGQEAIAIVEDPSDGGDPEAGATQAGKIMEPALGTVPTLPDPCPCTDTHLSGTAACSMGVEWHCGSSPRNPSTIPACAAIGGGCIQSGASNGAWCCDN